MFSAIMVSIALTIMVKLGRPVLFVQKRPGVDGVPFSLIKFRTMRCVRGYGDERDSDADRMTDLGRILRSTSLDELPSLLNVLKGDMSFVGPRPLLMEYLPLYSSQQRRRHEVRPGITGWAQVNGRNALNWEDRFQLDVWYVDNWTFWLDVKILALTVLRVIRRDGISEPGQATMSKFKGNN